MTGYYAYIIRDKYVEDLSTDEATSLFCGKFVKKWNRGELDAMYYKGIPEHVLEQTKRTKHTWGFVKRLDEKEVFALATARDSVGVATRKSDLLVSASTANARPVAPEGKSSVVGGPRQQEKDLDRHSHKRKSHHRERDSESDEDSDRHHRHRSAHKSERKKHRKHHEGVLEELAPKETGREAMLEKRRQVGSKLHGAARDREENRDGLDVSEEFLMGGSSGGGNDLQRRLKQREQVRGRKQQEAQEKLATFEVTLTMWWWCGYVDGWLWVLMLCMESIMLYGYRQRSRRAWTSSCKTWASQPLPSRSRSRLASSATTFVQLPWCVQLNKRRRYLSTAMQYSRLA